MANKLPNKRANGIYYTPDLLAEFLARPLITNNSITVFDPAYGQGSLLLAAEAIAKSSFPNQKLQLYGCDIHPVNGLLKHLPTVNLIEQDFFDYEEDQKFDVILTNPPYIRHQSQIKENIQRYRDRYQILQFLENASDMWAYFLVKSVVHLNPNGSIGAILPWSFLQANYAVKLRIWLEERFGEIRILGLNNSYFEAAEERVVLLWLTNYGQKNLSIESAFAQDFQDKVSYVPLTSTDWRASRVVAIGTEGLQHTFRKLKEHFSFEKLGQYAYSRIGIVTGANKFFIRDTGYCNKNGFKDATTIPILSNAKEFAGLLAEGPDSLKRLLILKEENKEQFQWLLEMGEKAEFNERSHSKARKPWYTVNPGAIPHAFFPYRVGKIPHLILNHDHIQSTNSIHRVYFNELNEVEKKWIFVSILSIYGQLSLTVVAKTYGRGMVKIEPSSLLEALVLVKNDSIVNQVYETLIICLRNGKKLEAVDKATEFIQEKMGIPAELQKDISQMYEALHHSFKRKRQ